MLIFFGLIESFLNELNDWCVDLLVVALIESFIDLLIAWFIDLLIHWSIDSLIYLLIHWLIDLLIDLLIYWSIYLSIHWFIDSLVVALIHWSVNNWLIDCCFDCSIDHCIYCCIDSLICLVRTRRRRSHHGALEWWPIFVETTCLCRCLSEAGSVFCTYPSYMCSYSDRFLVIRWKSFEDCSTLARAMIDN